MCKLFTMHMNKFLIEVFHATEVSVLFSFFFHFTDFLKHFHVKKKSFSWISGMFYIDQPLVIHSVNQKKNALQLWKLAHV